LITWINPENSLYVELSLKIWHKICKISDKLYPKEAGGILIGEYNKDLNRARIHDIYSSNENISSIASFVRKPRKTNNILRKLWDCTKGKKYFIGEWHSHPDGYGEASGLDEKTLFRIASNNKCACSRPILIIPSGNKKYGWSAKRIWIYTREKRKLTLITNYKF